MPAPPISALEQLSKLDRSLVDQVRSRFLAETRANPGQFSAADLAVVETNAWQTERFLLECKLNADNAVRAMVHAFQWRHAQQVHSLTASDFPAQYYRSGYIVRCGRDQAGATVLYFRANIHRKTTEWNELLKRFFVYQIEQVDLTNDGKGVTMVIDCASIGMANLDLDLLKFIVTSFSQYYPKLFDAIIVHELPYLLTYVFKLVQSWLPEDDRKFFHLTNKKTLTDHIAAAQLPTFVANGTSHECWWAVPDPAVLSAQQFVTAHGDRFRPDAADKLKFLNQYVK